MKTYFARGVLALLWYLVFVAIVFGVVADPRPDDGCSPDIGFYGLLIMAYMMAASVGLALYFIGRAIGWLVTWAAADPNWEPADDLFKL